MTQAATLIFLGRFRTESFLDFVRHYAERLGLRAGIGAVGANRIEVSVSGQTDLLDAFEVACSLGPIDCVVLDHRRIDAAANLPAGKPIDSGTSE